MLIRTLIIVRFICLKLTELTSRTIQGVFSLDLLLKTGKIRIKTQCLTWHRQLQCAQPVVSHATGFLFMLSSAIELKTKRPCIFHAQNIICANCSVTSDTQRVCQISRVRVCSIRLSRLQISKNPSPCQKKENRCGMLMLLCIWYCFAL